MFGGSNETGTVERGTRSVVSKIERSNGAIKVKCRKEVWYLLGLDAGRKFRGSRENARRVVIIKRRWVGWSDGFNSGRATSQALSSKHINFD